MKFKKVATVALVAGALNLLASGGAFAEGREHINWTELGVTPHLKEAITAGKAGNAEGFKTHLKAAYDAARDANKAQPDTDLEDLITKDLRPIKDNETMSPADGAAALEKVLANLKDR